MGGCLDGGRSRGAVERIDDEHRPLALLGAISREDFGREAFASLVQGRHLEAIHQPFFALEGVGVALHERTVVPSSVSQSGIDDVGIRSGGRLLRVDDPLPSQAETVLPAFLDGESGDGQGLHGIVGIVHHRRVFQNGFIHRACHGELESGVVSHLHIGKVLVREEFENHARHGRQARLAIIAVPHPPARPLDAISGGDVFLKPGEHPVRQVA